MVRKQSKGRTESLEISPSVDASTEILLINKLIQKAKALADNETITSTDVDAWNTTARDFLVRVFGSSSPNIDAVIKTYGDGGTYIDMPDEEYSEYLRSSLVNKLKFLGSCAEQLQMDLDLANNKGKKPEDTYITRQESSRVFVVHGHNKEIKESVARLLEKMGLEAVILHEKPNSGRTIIEKFTDYSDVGFAVVILTADDEAKSRGTDEDLKPRARQNVIFELGYFLGKLGRSRVCTLYESHVDTTSDYDGVLFVPLDQNERWKFDLVRELKEAGFSVDANRIFSV